jgi:hypothetical protein
MDKTAPAHYLGRTIWLPARSLFFSIRFPLSAHQHQHSTTDRPTPLMLVPTLVRKPLTNFNAVFVTWDKSVPLGKDRVHEMATCEMGQWDGTRA